MNPLRSVRILAILSPLIVLVGCGGGGGGNEPNLGSSTPRNPDPPPQSSVATTSAYVPGAPYAGVLRECTYAGDATRRCTLGTLPFIGMETDDAAISDIAARTLVSHTWMGRNLETVLARLPADVLPLFRSVTAVVIASDIRPAHYDPATGAIYLDPEFLWLSVAERDTVSDDPDPRSNYGLDLQFQMPWRFVRNNQRLTVFVNPDGSRDAGQIEEIMAYLLYHELAHAVDFVPPERFTMISPSQTVADVLDQFPPLSVAFQSAMPLSSTLLEDLAAVSFLGESSTAQQRAIQPEDLIDEFVNDGAVQYYAYTSRYEDFATLFETAMMKWHYGYDKDTAITNRPASGNTDLAVVAWGTRGRLGEQPVHNRVLDVGQRIYPGNLADFEAFLADQPPPLRLVAGDTWGDNLTPDGPSAQQAPTSGVDKSTLRPDYFLERIRIH